MHRDYGENDQLDFYDAEGLNDEEDLADMTGAQRRAAEAAMARRDRASRGGRGRRAAARIRAPGFLESDEDMLDDEATGGLLAGLKRRTRREYDERRDVDDAAGIDEDVRDY